MARALPISSFARATARLLTTRYVIALATVAVLSIAGQVLVQVALSRQAHDARTINLAGRQRNYSQAMCKNVLATRSVPTGETGNLWQETTEILTTWTAVHHALLNGQLNGQLYGQFNGEAKYVPPFSAALHTRFATLDPAFADLAARIHEASSRRDLLPEAVSGLLRAQRVYLDEMEAVVTQLDREAGERVSATRLLEATLFAFLTVVLVIEGLVIFRPVVRRIRDEIAAREHAEHTAIEREVAEVSGRLERRIGQDLHDGLGQVLTGISFQAKALQRRLGSGPEAESAADISSQVSQAIGQTRNLARMLHPVEADAHSLGAALHDLGATSEQIFGAQITVTWDEDLPLPQPTDDHEATPPSMHLFRIAQEAVSNAIRHGHARHLWISGMASPLSGHTTLTIDDDGDGFDPPSDPPTAATVHQLSAGMGLRIMAFRAHHIGATFTIERRATGGGMRVTVRW